MNEGTKMSARREMWEQANPAIRICRCGQKITPGVLSGVWLDQEGFDCCEDTADMHQPQER